MARRRRTWYSEQGTEERASAILGMVDLYRAGKFIATVPATPAETPTHAETEAMQRGGNWIEEA
jgi:hypothetical protein